MELNFLRNFVISLLPIVRTTAGGAHPPGLTGEKEEDGEREYACYSKKLMQNQSIEQREGGREGGREGEGGRERDRERKIQ